MRPALDADFLALSRFTYRACAGRLVTLRSPTRGKMDSNCPLSGSMRPAFESRLPGILSRNGVETTPILGAQDQPRIQRFPADFGKKYFPRGVTG